MRQRTIGDWFFRLTFALPLAAAVLMLGLLGLLGIADLWGGGAFGTTVWKVFLGAAAGLLGLVFAIRVLVLVAAAIGMILLTARQAAHGAILFARTALRGM